MKPSKLLIILFSFATGILQLVAQEVIAVWPGFVGGVGEARASGNLLFISGRYTYGSLQVWDLAERRFIKTLHQDRGAADPMVSADGKYLATRGIGLAIWDLAAGASEPIATWRGTNQLEFLGFQSKSNRAVFLAGNQVKVWDFLAGQVADGPMLTGTSFHSLGAPDGENAAVMVGPYVQMISLSTFQQRTIGGIGEYNYPIAAAISPDGKKIAAATYYYAGYSTTNPEIRVFDVASAQLERTFVANASQVTSVAFAPDRAVLASADKDRTLILWDLNSGERLKDFAVHSRSYDPPVAFSGDGKTLVCGNLFVNQETGATEALSEQITAVSNVQMSDDGALVATEAHLFDVKKGRHVATLYDAPRPPSGSIAAAAGSDYEPRISSFMRGYQPIHFTKDGQRLYVSRGIYDTANGAKIGMLPAPDVIESVRAFAANWYYTSGTDGDVARLRSYDDGAMIKNLFSPITGGSSAIATSDSGELIATTGYYFKHMWDFVDSSIKIWNSGTGDLITTLSNRQWLPYRLVISKDERLVASISDMNNPEVSVWDIREGRELLKIREPVPPSAGIDLLPDSRTLVYGSMNSLQFWDVFTKKLVAETKKEASFITAISVAPDGKTVAVGRIDGTVVVYSAPSTDPMTISATGGAEMSLSFVGRIGVVYTVEASGDLENWEAVKTVTGDGGTVRVAIDPVGRTFYRLR